MKKIVLYIHPEYPQYIISNDQIQSLASSRSAFIGNKTAYFVDKRGRPFNEPSNRKKIWENILENREEDCIVWFEVLTQLLTQF